MSRNEGFCGLQNEVLITIPIGSGFKDIRRCWLIFMSAFNVVCICHHHFFDILTFDIDTLSQFLSLKCLLFMNSS